MSSPPRVDLRAGSAGFPRVRGHSEAQMDGTGFCRPRDTREGCGAPLNVTWPLCPGLDLNGRAGVKTSQGFLGQYGRQATHHVNVNLIPGGQQTHQRWEGAMEIFPQLCGHRWRGGGTVNQNRWLFKEDFISFFWRDRRGGRKRGRETSMCEIIH